MDQNSYITLLPCVYYLPLRYALSPFYFVIVFRDDVSLCFGLEGKDLVL